MSSVKEILIYKGFHRILNTRRSSRAFGRFANAKLYPPFLRLLIRIYIKAFKIDLSDYDFDMQKVRTFNEFFTRKLKRGKRVWGKGICSPVDGKMLSHGKVENDMAFQVKGNQFRLSDLVNKSSFLKGSFINLYLSPADYHRVHAPFDMQIERIEHLPSELYSVSVKNAQRIKNLYVKNERVVLSGNSDYGRFHFVFVGALNVGSIRLSHFPEFKSNLPAKAISRIDELYSVSKGEEIGWFEMGSTVLIFIEDDNLENILSDAQSNKVRLGTTLA